MNAKVSFYKKLFLFAIFSLSTLHAEVFRFSFSEGDTYRINSFVQEDVYINMAFSHTAEITNRITVDVSDVQSPENEPSSALFTCTFMTSEKNSKGENFNWSKQYPSVFRRDEFGNYTINNQYFMPIVRNVPVFPEHDLAIGDTWTGDGHEAHDFRDVFGLKDPYIVPFTVTYTYKGPTVKDGYNLQLITAEYHLIYELPTELVRKHYPSTQLFPVKTLGTSKQNLYWDAEIGNLRMYDEEFNIRLILNTGDVCDFVGIAHAVITDLKTLDKKKTVDDVNRKIDELGLSNIQVKETDEGVTISIENIQFTPDSAILLPSELEKLDKLALVLQEYAERDLLITGHTALAGTKEGRDRLSLERANAVAQYLIQKGVREDHRVFTQGFGADRPVAPNDTEENRAKNRRVEITIIDK